MSQVNDFLDGKQQPSEIDSFLGPEPAKPAGALRRMQQGIGNTIDAARISATNRPDEIAGIIVDSEKSQLPASPAQIKMQEEFAPYAKKASEAKGALNNVVAWGGAAAKRVGQFIENPSEFSGMIAENLPNSAPGIAGGLAGAYVGSAAGPVGTAVGGVVGGTAGGYAIEQGSSMKEQIQKEAQARGVNTQDKAAMTALITEKYPEFLKASRLKGVGTAGTDAALNVLTMGIAGAGERAIAKEARNLTASVKAGSIGASEAATKLAEIEAKNVARNSLGATAKRHAGITASEMLGEGISEGVGQKLAYGQVDAGDVIDESLLGLGTGVGMAVGSKSINRITGGREFSPADAEIKRAEDAMATSPVAPQVEPLATQPASTPLGLPAPTTLVDSQGNAVTTEQRQAEREQKAADYTPFRDVTPIPAQTPSQEMGLAPTVAPSITNAAIVAVDSGVHESTKVVDPVQQARDEYYAQTQALEDQRRYDEAFQPLTNEEMAQDSTPSVDELFPLPKTGTAAFFAKKKQEAQANASNPTGVQPLSATSVPTGSDNGTAGVGTGNADGGRNGNNAATPTPSGVGQSGESTGVPAESALKDQPTGETANAKSPKAIEATPQRQEAPTQPVANVEQPSPRAQTEPQAAQDQAPAVAGSTEAGAQGLPGAGSAAVEGGGVNKALDKVSNNFWKGETFRDIAPQVVRSPDVYTKKEPKFTGSNLLDAATEFDYFMTDGRRSQKISKEVYDHIESLKPTHPVTPQDASAANRAKLKAKNTPTIKTEIVPDIPQPTESTNEKAPEAQQVQAQPEAGTTAGVSEPAAVATGAGKAEGVEAKPATLKDGIEKIRASKAAESQRLAPAQALKLQEAHKAHGPDVTLGAVQKMYDRVMKMLITGKGSNGGVQYDIKPKDRKELQAQADRLTNDLSLFGVQDTQQNESGVTHTVESVAKTIQQKIASNRRKAQEKSRKDREAKGWQSNSTPESEQAGYDAEVSAEPGEAHQRSASALLGDNPLPLIEMFVNGNFEASEEVFKEITGVRIRGLSAAGKKAALYKWADWTPEQIAQAEQDASDKGAARAEKFKQDDLKDAVRGAWLALDNLKVKTGDSEVTGQEYVTQTIASGFDQAHKQKKGVATIYGLTDGKSFTTLKVKPFNEFVKAAMAFGGLDKAMEYVNPPKPQAPEGFVDRSVNTADAKREPIEHSGLKIYPANVKVGDKVEQRWVVQSLNNAERERNGERQIGGDPMAETLDEAKQLAEQESASAKVLEQYRAEMAKIDDARKAESEIAQAKKDANKGKSIAERRKDAFLDGPTKLHPNAGLGTGTKRESMQKAVEQDRYIKSAMVRDEAAKKRDQEATERARRNNLPTGNINYPGVKEYFEAQARLKANKYEKPEYRVYMGRDGSDSFYEITKTEYDYAQELKAQQATRETITPADDKNIGVNVDGNQLYERKDGSIYQMQDGKPRFSGFLEPVSASKEAVAPAAQPITRADVTAAQQQAAAIIGERIDALKDVKKGDITPEELQAAYPAKEDGEKTEPWKMTRAEAADAFPGDEYDKMLNRHAVLGDITYEEANKRSRINITGNKEFWAKTRKDLLQDKKDAVKFARGDRAEVNKMKPTEGFAAWRIKSMSATGKAAIEAAGKYHDELLAVHKERVQEALDEGKDVPAEVLADYPDLAKPDDSVKPEAKSEISDFGEVLPGARKDAAPSLKTELSDNDIATQPLSKIWPADEYLSIDDKFASALSFAARAEIPAKPRTSYKVKNWVEKVKTVRDLAQRITSGSVTRERMAAELAKTRSLSAFADKIALLEAIDREHWPRIDSVEVYPDAYRYNDDGTQTKTPLVRVSIDGRSRSFDGATSVADVVERVIAMVDTEQQQTKKMQFEVRGTESKGFGINKKGDKEYRKLKTFPTAKEAFEFIKAGYDDLVAEWEGIKDRDNVKKDDVRGTENRPRSAKDYRNGKDVTSEQFAETFGFRGGQFGKWVNQGEGRKDRQGMLNQAYDALMDLSDIVGIPPRAVSLNGTLGLAFGARGSGTASAHYEPDTLVINLTKTRGAGVLAHEWFHALDNYFSHQRGGAVPMSPGMTQLDYRKANYITYKPEPLYVHKTKQSTPITKATLERYASTSGSRGQPGGYYDPKNWHLDPQHPEGVRPEVERRIAELVEALNASPMAQRAAMNDKAPEGYWSRIIERAARSFENYVISKMMERGYHNDYLANVREVGDFPRSKERYPYLLPEEVKPIAEAFDNLFSTIQTKETDGGNVAMFSRPRFSRGAQSQANESVERLATGIASHWENAPKVVVAFDMNDPVIPENVRKEDQRQRSGGATGTPEGFYYKGTVYLMSSKLATDKDIARVLFHEALGHYGLRSVYGKSLKIILSKIATFRKAEVAAKMEQYGLKGINSLDRMTAAEEVLAEMAQDTPSIGLVREAVAAVRTWLRENVPGFKNLNMTDDEIIRSYILPARNFVERGTRPSTSAATPAFSRTVNGAPVFSRSAILQQVGDKLNETLNHPGTVSKWHTTVGSMYNLAERSPAFKRVFDAAQGFLNDVSYYATEAADMAPKILPKLENWRDIGKSPISYADNKAIAAPIFEGTLGWARDEQGKPIRIEDKTKAAEELSVDQKAQRLLRGDKISEGVLKMWRGLPIEQFETAVESSYEKHMLRPGVAWTDKELASMFRLTPEQIGLYQEFRRSVDNSIDNAAKAGMLRTAGKDAADLKQMVMDAPTADAAGVLLRDHLLQMAEDYPERAAALVDSANSMMDQADKASKLKAEGYAPLSRFGQYSVDVVVNGERQEFRMFEDKRSSNQFAMQMRGKYGAANVAQSTMSQKEFEQFQGITPETMELFGNMLGLDATGSEASDQVFQKYLKMTKANRSAMKRLIHRKGTAGYSEDVGRVLASFVYSNARHTAGALNLGDLGDSVNAIPKEQGQLKDVAIKLQQYVTQPEEEAQAIRGLMFTQYLGGSVASAMINLTQPMTVSFPYLSQFGGVKQASSQLVQAYKDMANKNFKYEDGLAKAMKVAEEQGVVSPQEVHQLQAQARGVATLKGGDGTKMGDAMAQGQNALAKVMMGWGKLFGIAEQINRRSTFVAAYRIAIAQKLSDPAAFATKAVNETQFINNRGNKMQWGRGAVGATLMTFKSYSFNFLELFHRMATQNGPEGKKAAALMMAVLFLTAGAGGLPFADDLDDLLDFIGQKLGYNFSSKKAKQQFLEDLLGKAGAQFVARGLTGLPGSPIDVSGRMSMGNLIPATGLLLDKRDSSRDVQELLGPIGDMAKRAGQSAGALIDGDFKRALLAAAPRAITNLAQGADMGSKGYYADAKGYKVLDTNPAEAAFKAIGFQPQSVSSVQESNGITQRMKEGYNLRAQDIRARWAKGLFEQDASQVQSARDMLKDWNDKNPDQRMIIDLPSVWKKVREMAKPKDQRIAETAPKAMRAQLKRDLLEQRG